jgi:DNA-binding NarL/FixJ family response regulator
MQKAESIISEIDNLVKESCLGDSTTIDGDYIHNLHKIEFELDRFKTTLMNTKNPQSSLDELLAQLTIIQIGRCKNAIYETLRHLHTDYIEKQINDDTIPVDQIKKTPNRSKTVTDDIIPKKMCTTITEVALTNKQRDIIKYLLQGMTTREISINLEICEKTVKNHLSKIYKRLGVKNRIQLYNKFVHI